MRKLLFQVYVLLSALLVVGCGQATSSSLPPTADPSSNASTQVQPPASPPPCQAHASGGSLDQPATPSSVYFGSADGTVVALDATSGAVRWRAPLADAHNSTVVALEAGVVYVHASDPGGSRTFVDAFRASDGVFLWHQGFTIDSAVAEVRQGVVYLTLGASSTTSSAIEARRAQDGALLWRTQLEGTGLPQARLDQGTLYVTSFSTLLPGPGYYYASTHLDALTASSGVVCWHRVLARTNWIAAMATGQVYLLDTGTDVVCEPRILHVLGASSGAELWQRQESFLELLGVDQERAYVEGVPEGCVASAPSSRGHCLPSTRRTVPASGSVPSLSA